MLLTFIVIVVVVFTTYYGLITFVYKLTCFTPHLPSIEATL